MMMTTKRTRREEDGTKSKRQRLAVGFHLKFMHAKSPREACEVNVGDTVSILWCEGSPFEHWKLVSISGSYLCQGESLETVVCERKNIRMTMCFLDTRRGFIPKEDAIFTWWVPYENESEDDDDEEEFEELEDEPEEELEEEEEEEDEEEEEAHTTEPYKCANCWKVLHQDCFSKMMKKQPAKERKCLWCTTRQKNAVVVAPPPLPDKPFKNVGSYKNDGWTVLGRKANILSDDDDSSDFTSADEEEK